MEGFKYAVKERARYQYIDIQGIVNHTRYVEFLSGARIEYFRNLGITTKSMTEKGYDLVTRELHCYFEKPAYLDAIITIHIRMDWMRNSSFGFAYILEDESGDILLSGKSTHIMLDLKSRKATRIPDEYRDIFQRFEGRLLASPEELPAPKC